MVIRSLPRVEDNIDKYENGRGRLERWLVSELPEKADLFLSSFLAKWLRKTKVFLLKIDNILSEHLKKVAPSSGSKSESSMNAFRDMKEKEE